MLDFIEQTINELDPTFDPVCDLFSGSGSVAFRLANKRQVTTIDIQEYSRVLCSAVLNKSIPLEISSENFIDNCMTAKNTVDLAWCFEPLINYEDACTEKALDGKVHDLCEIIETGAIVLRQQGKTIQQSKSLSSAMTETFSRLKAKKLLSDQKTIIARYYGGVYFSYKQAVHIDAVLEQINNLKRDKDLFLAALLSTASNIVNTVGKQFAQPIRPKNTSGDIKPGLGSIAQKDRSLNVFTELKKWCEKYIDIPAMPFRNSVIRSDYAKGLSQINKGTKVIYADPPYTRDHYSRYYHILETICLRDNPILSTMTLDGKTQISRGLYRTDRHQSPFCIKSQAPKAFEILMSKAHSINASLVLSYSPYDETKNSHPRMMKMNDLLMLARQFYKEVDVTSPGQFLHSKLTNSQKHLQASENAEVLIICKR